MNRTISALMCLLASFALVLAGCGPDRARMTKEEIKHNSFLLNSDDFDLETVIGIVKGNGVKNIEELEKTINDGSTGINNVDIDNDEKIDYVMVKENREGENFTLEFLAVPSKTGKEDEANLIASMSIKKSGENVNVSGGYPDYVAGHDTHHYHYSHAHHGMSFGQALFLAYMFSPRPMYYRPYGTFAYSPRPYMSASQRSTARSTYRSTTTTKVAPVKKQAKPANYKSPKSASKTKSRFNSGAIKGKPGDKSLSSRKGQTTNYKQRSSSQPKKKATGFGGGNKSKPTSKPKSRSSWGRSSSSRSSGRSFGGGRSSALRRRRKKVIEV